MSRMMRTTVRRAKAKAQEESQQTSAVTEVSAEGQANSAEAVAMMKGLRKQSSQLDIFAGCKLDGAHFNNRPQDCFAVLFYKNTDGELEDVARTEVARGELDITWLAQMRVLYRFEELQPLVVRLYDGAGVTGDNSELVILDSVPMFAEAEILLAELVTAENHTMELDVVDNLSLEEGQRKVMGTLDIAAEEVSSVHTIIKFKASAVLELSTFFAALAPFLQICRRFKADKLTKVMSKRYAEEGRVEDEMEKDKEKLKQWTPVFRSEVKYREKCPGWDEIQLTLQQLCGADMDRELLFEVFDFGLKNRHRLLAWMTLTANQLQEHAQSGTPLPLKKARRGKHFTDPSAAPVGHLMFSSCELVPQHTFIDFVNGGCEVEFMVAIDFTASNGDPNVPGTLHYVDPDGNPNPYEQAIIALGNVLQFYSTDNTFPVWGYGAQPFRDQDTVSHCFPLNNNPNDPEVHGVDGILQAYREAIRSVGLAGPTFFTPIIKEACMLASKEGLTQAKQRYFCLLIVTDGMLLDLDDTIGQLVESADLPLSILIFGVGNANFARMRVIDANKENLTSVEGKQAIRDNVSFFPLRDFKSPDQISRKMLADLPVQLLSCFDLKGIVPNRRLNASYSTRSSRRRTHVMGESSMRADIGSASGRSGTAVGSSRRTGNIEGNEKLLIQFDDPPPGPSGSSGVAAIGEARDASGALVADHAAGRGFGRVVSFGGAPEIIPGKSTSPLKPMEMTAAQQRELAAHGMEKPLIQFEDPAHGPQHVPSVH